MCKTLVVKIVRTMIVNFNYPSLNNLPCPFLHHPTPMHTHFCPDRMFEAHPEWKSLFKKFSAWPLPDSDPAFSKQVEATRGMLEKAVGLALSDQDKLKQTLNAMAKRHVGYGVNQEQFQVSRRWYELVYNIQ